MEPSPRVTKSVSFKEGAESMPLAPRPSHGGLEAGSLSPGSDGEDDDEADEEEYEEAEPEDEDDIMAKVVAVGDGRKGEEQEKKDRKQELLGGRLQGKE